MNSPRGILIVFGIVLMVGCMTQTGDAAPQERHIITDSADKIIAVQTGGTVIFSFYVFNRDLQTDEPTRARSLGLFRQHDSELLWEIDAQGLDVGAQQIVYGEVPKGFVQRRPFPATPPPALEAGTVYIVTGRLQGRGLGLGVGQFTYRRTGSP